MSTIVKNQIIEYLKKNKISKTKNIQEKFNLTLSTTRRYLIQLEQENIIERLFGEIVYKENKTIISDNIANENILSNVESKKEIAMLASKFVANNTPIFLDSGSSCFYLLDYLDLKTVIYTNSLFNANYAIKKGFENVHILGGKVKLKTESIVNLDNDFVKKIYFPISFIGVNGIDENERLTTPEESEGQTKKLICEHSDLIVVLCEENKFNKKALFDFTPKDKQIVVVTNSNKKPDFANKYLYVLKKERK